MPRPDPIVQAERIKLVDDKFPTDARRKVAEYIDEHWNDADELTLTKIAEDTETSRQHVKNTLEAHFEIVGSGPSTSNNTDSKSVGDIVEIALEAYRMGYRDGRQDSAAEADGSIDQLVDRLE